MGQFTVPVATETRRVASRQNRFNTPAIRSVMESLRIAASNGYVHLYLDEGAELETSCAAWSTSRRAPHRRFHTRARCCLLRAPHLHTKAKCLRVKSGRRSANYRYFAC